jgi:hypothetical protein
MQATPLWPEVAILHQNFSREREDLRGLWNRFQLTGRAAAARRM